MSSRFTHDLRIVALLLLMVHCPPSSRAGGDGALVTLDAGTKSLSHPERVHAAGLGRPRPFLRKGDGPETKPPIVPPASSEGTASPVPSPLPADRPSSADRPHLLRRAGLFPTGATGTLNTILYSPENARGSDEETDGSQAARLAAPGRETWLVNGDGVLDFRPVLRTWEGATCTLRLLDEKGEEVLFDGASLFSWSRPNDKARALPRWKGRNDPSALYEEGAGNWTPREDLRYDIALRKGQKLILELSGRPAPDAHLDLKGVSLSEP